MRDLGKLIGAKDFKKLPKVQKIARSGHIDGNCCTCALDQIKSLTFKLIHEFVNQFVGNFITRKTSKTCTKLICKLILNCQKY